MTKTAQSMTKNSILCLSKSCHPSTVMTSQFKIIKRNLFADIIQMWILLGVKQSLTDKTTISRKLFTMRFSFTVWYAAECNLVIWNLKTIIYITIRICILCRTNAGCWVLELISSSNWIFTEITFRLNISENTLNFKGFKVWILQVATWSKLTYTTKVVHNPMPSRPRIIFGHPIWKT